MFLTSYILVAFSGLTVTNSRHRIVLNVAPNAFPATKVIASRDLGDNSVVEYVQVEISPCSFNGRQVLTLVLYRILTQSLQINPTSS
jgi:hypothetical protein